MKSSITQTLYRRFTSLKPCRLVFVILVLICAGIAQNLSKADNQAIMRLEDKINEAMLKGDLAGSEHYLAGDYVRVYPDGSVAPTDDLRNMMKFSSLEISERQVHGSGDTAVSVFKAQVKATAHGQPIDGVFRCVRTWARHHGEWKAVAFSSTRIEGETAQPPDPSEHANVKANVFLSEDRPRLHLTVAPAFTYLGKFPFDIRGIAGGYRYVWGEFDHGRHLRRTFIIQAEGYYPNNNGFYDYGAPNPVVIGGDTYQHNVWIYDNDESAAEQPGNESDLTRKFMQDHGYEWEPQLVMSRFARVVDDSRKNEIIFFYFENLKDYSAKKVKDFPEEPATAEQKKILDSVDANSGKAFTIAH